MIESDFLTDIILGVILYLVIKNEVRHYESSETVIIIRTYVYIIIIYLIYLIFKNYIL